MKLIVFPLVMLICLSFLSLLGLGIVNEGNTNVYGTAEITGYYDADGHQVSEANRTTLTGETGRFHHVQDRSQPQHGEYGRLYWINASGTYEVWSTPDGENAQDATLTFDLFDSLGLIIIVTVTMGVATLAGVKFFGTGISTAKELFLVTALITIWGVFSTMGLSMLLELPLFFGAGFYFFLTSMYCLGIINQVGGGGDDL